MDAQPPNDAFACYNYCVGFIDLLGQRDAMKGQGLLPSDKAQLVATFKNSLGAIIGVQRHAEAMLQPLLNPNRDSPLRAQLPPEQYATWDEIMRTRVTTQ